MKEDETGRKRRGKWKKWRKGMKKRENEKKG